MEVLHLVGVHVAACTSQHLKVPFWLEVGVHRQAKAASGKQLNSVAQVLCFMDHVGQLRSFAAFRPVRRILFLCQAAQ